MSSGTVAIVGSGAVGSAVAFALILREACSKVVIYDAFSKVSEGKFLDLAPARWAFGGKVSVERAETLPEKADVFVITAGFPRKPGMTRKDLLSENERIVLPILEKIRDSGAVAILVTNPVDLLVKSGVEKAHFPKNRLIGSSSLLDSSRFSEISGKKSVVIGPHNERMLPLGAKSPEDEEKVRKWGAEIIEKLGTSSQYSPGAVIAKTVELVLSGNPRREIIPCSVYLDGWNGFSKTAFGVPAILGKGGIVEILPPDISEEDSEKLREAVSSLGE